MNQQADSNLKTTNANTALQDMIATEKQAITIVNKNITKIQTKLAETRTLEADAGKTLQNLRDQEAAAVERNVAAQQECSAEKIALDKKQQDVRLSIDERREKLHQEIIAAQKHYAQNCAEREKSLSDANLIMNELMQKRGILLEIRTEQEEKHLPLFRASSELNAKYTQLVNDAVSAHAMAVIERVAAQKSSNLAQKSLEKTLQKIAELEDEIAARQEEADNLHQEKNKDITRIKQENEARLRELREAESVLARKASEKRNACKKAESFANLSQKLYIDIQGHVAELANKITKACDEMEIESTSVAHDMENALRTVINERKSYSALLEACNEQEKAAAAADKEELRIRDSVLHLRIDDNDLRNAALVASDLAADATVARINADPGTLESIQTMERELLAAAADAKRMSKEKTIELREAEAAELLAIKDAELQRGELVIAKQAVTQAEQQCQKAEQALRDLNTIIEQRASERNENDNALSMLRIEYEQATHEASVLKESSITANTNLRAIKMETEQIEHDFAAASAAASQQIAKAEHNIASAEKQWHNKLEQAFSLLNMAKDYRDNVISEQTKKENNYKKWLDTLEIAIKKETSAAEETQKTKLEADQTIAANKQQQDEIIAQDEIVFRQACSDAEESEKKYEETITNSINIANKTQQSRELLQVLDQKKIQLEELFSIELKETAAAIEERLANIEIKLGKYQEEVNFFSNPIQLAIIELESTRQRRGELEAALEAEYLRREFQDSRLMELEEKYNAIVAAEEQRLADLAAANLLAKRKAEENRLRLEEEEKLRNIKELRRLQEEQEAAHIAAEAERARLASEAEERRAAAEAEAMLLAAGQVLDKDVDLEVISSGELINRMDGLEEQAKKEASEIDCRWMSSQEQEQLRSDASISIAKAAEARGLFDAAQSTMVILSKRLRELQDERYALGPIWAAQIARVDHIDIERKELQLAKDKFYELISPMGQNVQDMLIKSADSITNALDKNIRELEEANLVLVQMEKEIATLDETIKQTKQEHREAQTLLNEITYNWIHYENTALKNKAKLDLLEAELKDKASLQTQADEYVSAAKEAVEKKTPAAKQKSTVKQQSNLRKRNSTNKK